MPESNRQVAKGRFENVLTRIAPMILIRCVVDKERGGLWTLAFMLGIGVYRTAMEYNPFRRPFLQGVRRVDLYVHTSGQLCSPPGSLSGSV